MVCETRSFQLNDGICDDKTNIVECGYDGGDCCREQKLTHLCNECQCVLSIDEEDLKTRLKLHKVKMISKQSQDTNHYSAIKIVEQVVSTIICAQLCLAQSRKDIDSWTYESSKKTCICTRLEKSCIEFEDFRTVTQIVDDDNTFFLMTALVSQCGQYEKILNMYIFDYS